MQKREKILQNSLDFHSRNLFYSFCIIILAFFSVFINRFLLSTHNKFKFSHFGPAFFSRKHSIIHSLNENLSCFFPCVKIQFSFSFRLFIIHKTLFIISHLNFMFLFPPQTFVSSNTLFYVALIFKKSFRFV
jgi:hypothetical protein